MSTYNSNHTGAQLDEALNKALNPDTTPSTGSSNLVTSGAVKDYVDAQASNKLDTSLKGAASGLAELDASGKVPTSQLPAYVDDVLEYTAKASFPATGETGKIYVDTSTNKTYRWSGSAYTEISPSLALGETSSTAYRGDRGKTAYDHSQVKDGSNPHSTTFANIASKPTTISGYGITDAKIASGTITLGSNTITPLTSSSSLNAAKLTGTASISTTGNAATATTANSLKDVTASAAELNILDGATLTTTELNYVDGVTSNIQTQLNNKATSSHTHNYAGSDSVGGAATRLKTTVSGGANTDRPVFFSSTTQGDVVYDEDFKYNPSTNTLTVGKITGNAATANKLVWTSIPANSDLNNYKTGGVYEATASSTAQTITNKPSDFGSDNGFLLEVIEMTNDMKLQVLYGTVRGGIHKRRWGNSNWSEWVRMATYAESSNASNLSSGTVPAARLPAASTSANGAMSSADKTKMNYTNIAYGTCSTAAATAAKVITVSGNTNWALTAGSRITIKFSATNTASNPTFNVNGTGAKSVWYGTAVITTGSLSYAGYANRPMDFVYDGTQYVFIGWSADTNTTYSNASLGQGYGTCSTAEATVAKVVSLSSYSLTTGGIVAVKFTYAVPASATMNINSKGAKSIYYKGAKITAGIIKAGDTATFIYNGTYYHLLTVDRDDNTVPTLSSLGVTATATELNYVDGVTSAIQTQLNGKLSTSGTAAKATADASGNTITTAYAASLTQSGSTLTLKSKSGATLSTVTVESGSTTTSVNVSVATSAWAASSTYTGYGFAATVTATGVTASNNIIVGMSATATLAQEEACAAAGVQCKAQAANSITLYAKTKPTVALPITVMIM